MEGRGTGIIEFITPSGAPVCRIELDLVRQEVRLHGQDRPGLTALLDEAFWAPAMDVRLFVDASVMELFINDALSLTTRNSRLDGTTMRLALVEGDLAFRTSHLFVMKAAFPALGRRRGAVDAGRA